MSRIETRLGKSVLLVGDFLSGSIANRSVSEDLAVRLSGAGWNVVTTSTRLNRFARMTDMATTAWRQRQRYGVAQVDVFSGLAFSWAEVVCWILRRAGKPYGLTLRGGGLPRFGKRWPKRVGRLLRSAVAVTTPSRFLLEHMNGYREDMHLIPNPLDLAAYEFRPRRQPRPRLIWLRAFHEIYNPELAVRTLALLAEGYQDARLTMVGPDKGDGSFQKARRLESESALSGRVDWPGGVSKSDVPMWMNKGDIYLNTPNVDNTPVTVLEAMACGLCVVSTDVGGIPYLLENEEDALLVPPDDPRSMACAVRRFLEDPGVAERVSGNGRRKVENCDWSVVLPQWESLFQTYRNKS